MARRHALATQADLARAIRAAQAAGLTRFRVVARLDGVSIETKEHSGPDEATPDAPRKKIVL